MKRLTFLFILWLASIVALGQRKLELIAPTQKLLPKGDFYLAADFNNWDPGDPRLQFKKKADGNYELTIPDSVHVFEFKITQGTWHLVEGTMDGNVSANRRYDDKNLGASKNYIIQLLGWEKKATYRIIVNKIPAATPFDAKLYVTGNFNNWNPKDENYQLIQHTDGSYRTTILSELTEIQFKITRGNWASVECYGNGKARPNRKIDRTEKVQWNPRDIEHKINIDVENWEDLTGIFNFFDLYSLFLLFASFNGILLMIAIPTIQNSNWAANRWLILLIGIISVMLLLKVIASDRGIAQTFPKLLLLPDFIVFAFAPLYHLYIEKLLFKSTDFKVKWRWIYLPILLQVMVYLPYFNLDYDTFRYSQLNNELSFQILFLVVGISGIIWNFIQWNKFRKILDIYLEKSKISSSFEENLSYLSITQIIYLACIVLGIMALLIYTMGYVLDEDLTLLSSQIVDFIWIVFASSPFFLGYYAIHQPEIFKISQKHNILDSEMEIDLNMPVQSGANYGLETKEHVKDELAEKIMEMMEKDKPYLNPKLTLNDLAHQLNVSPHVMSKTLNDSFQKNFFDFINTYRTKEFKEKLDDPKFQNYTFLAVAYEAGFNSKTAFNRSFKRVTGQSPSEYLQSIQPSENVI
ncbi:helix-turn-helix domain-containing protein [Aquirufa rosea]|uniref:Helix-turn-helix domain-containing protein n=1 Tax=Aquirufa rosea TaxID=2509241 RepID=A0A4Q1BX09_9BACT|nr:helix-turn-helix domain-containing protein [Aquirufa rosea]RXK46537.1 helix-turn-helix domain-containing protein [Aquirufa rosea]